MAQIDRIEEIAKKKNNQKLAGKVAKLRELENKRYNKALKGLEEKEEEEEEEDDDDDDDDEDEDDDEEEKEDEGGDE